MRTNKSILLISSLVLLSGAVAIGSPSPAHSKHDDSFFSTPNPSGKETPAFKDRPQNAQNGTGMVSAEGETPRQDIINSLPSLTEVQRKAIRGLFDQSRKDDQPLNDQISALDKQIKLATELKEKKAAEEAKLAAAYAAAHPASPSKKAAPNTVASGAPSNTVEAGKSSKNAVTAGSAESRNSVASSSNAASTGVVPAGQTASTGNAVATSGAASTKTDKPSSDVQDSPLLSLEVLKAEQSGLKQAIKDNATKLSHQIAAVLTADQIAELESMRRGTLIIGRGTDTDAGASGPPKQMR